MHTNKLDIHSLQGVVRGIALKFRDQLESSMSQEDIEQELWEKLWIIHQNKKDVFSTLPPVEQIKSAKVFLKRKAIDILRSKNRSLDSKIDSNRVIEMCGVEEEAFGDMVELVSAPFQKSESELEYKELQGLIVAWIEKQPKQIQLVMQEKFNPSTETLQKWDELCENYPRYKGYESIPGPTLCNLLKVDRSYWYRGIKDLQNFLREKNISATC